MIDPETARQAEEAVAEWNAALLIRGTQSDITNLLCRAGDALAVLVPQLLDQNAWFEGAANQAEYERDALGERCRQLEMERDQAHRFAQRFEAMAMDARAECDALGERCRQLANENERLLSVGGDLWNYVEHARGGPYDDVTEVQAGQASAAWERLMVEHERARAALGDTPPPEPRTTDRPSQESLVRLAQRERKEPTIRTLNTGPDVLIEDERGDAAVSPEPSYSVPMTATGAAAVEPPQPETPA